MEARGFTSHPSLFLDEETQIRGETVIINSRSHSSSPGVPDLTPCPGGCGLTGLHLLPRTGAGRIFWVVKPGPSFRSLKGGSPHRPIFLVLPSVFPLEKFRMVHPREQDGQAAARPHTSLTVTSLPAPSSHFFPPLQVYQSRSAAGSSGSNTSL